jgi:hypothetical protein
MVSSEASQSSCYLSLTSFSNVRSSCRIKFICCKSPVPRIHFEGTFANLQKASEPSRSPAAPSPSLEPLNTRRPPSLYYSRQQNTDYISNLHLIHLDAQSAIRTGASVEYRTPRHLFQSPLWSHTQRGRFSIIKERNLQGEGTQRTAQHFRVRFSTSEIISLFSTSTLRYSI